MPYEVSVCSSAIACRCTGSPSLSLAFLPLQRIYGFLTVLHLCHYSRLPIPLLNHVVARHISTVSHAD
jgi:hypothetical protein